MRLIPEWLYINPSVAKPAETNRDLSERELKFWVTLPQTAPARYGGHLVLEAMDAVLDPKDIVGSRTRRAS
ncbi:MAG TPA: hypothetical protein VLG37_02630 [Candidatus Saccharimonadales bacterium]|nr:hypothetical protein [Candidatus Saccharimonadales bacterium]